MKKAGPLLLLLAIGISSLSTQRLYFSSFLEIYEIDLTNCEYTKLTEQAAGQGILDLSYNPNGNIYYVDFEAIYKFSLITGQTEFLRNLNTENGSNAMTSDNNGLVYLYEEGKIYTYNPADNSMQLQGPTQATSGGDLAFYDGELLIASFFNTIQTVSINGSPTTIIDNSEDIDGQIFGIVANFEECTEPEIYAISTTEGNTSNIYRVDFENNAYNFVCQIPLQISGGASSTEYLTSEPFVLKDVSVINTSCLEQNGIVEVEACGRFQPITYTLEGRPPQSNGFFDGLIEGRYTIEMTDGQGNELTTTATVFENQEFNLGPVTTTPSACGTPTGSIQLQLPGDEADYTYSLNGNFVTNLGNLPAATYVLTVEKDLGCALDTTIIIPSEICDVYFPTAFSPNLDGVNDFFRGQAAANIMANVEAVSIYSRWGDLLYQSGPFDFNASNLNSGWWNGDSTGGEPLNSGLYIYTVKLIFDGEQTVEYSGQVQLLR